MSYSSGPLFSSAPLIGKKPRAPKINEVPEDIELVEFLVTQRETLQRLREEATCVAQSPIRTFQHRLLLNNLNVELLEQDLQSILVFDHALHHELGCLMDALVHRYTEESVHDRVRTTITTPVPLEKDKDNVFTSGLRGNDNLFVIKTDTISNVECLYEYVVGKILINPLRAVIPNFMYTYGYHECAAYAVNKGKTLRWCNTDEPDMGYLYLEKINGVRMNDFLLDHREDTPEFAEVMLQIINALYIADEHCSFRHCDLKPDNIMIRELAEPINVPFTVLGKEQYVRSRWIPQIIDFGISTSMYRGKKLIPSIHGNVIGNSARDFPYDLDYLLKISTYWFSDRDSSRLREIFYDRLMKDGKKEPNRTFTHIAKVFIKIFGGDAIHTREDGALTLPFTVIGDADSRFYQRYFLERSYHVAEYYDLINLIRDYNLRQTPTVPTNTDIVQIANTISDEVSNLMNKRSTAKILYLQQGRLRTALDDILVIIDTIADYAYTLRSFERIALPLARKYKLITKADEKRVKQITVTVSNIYQELMKEAYELYPATERAYLHAGYNKFLYNDKMRDLALKMALMPRLEAM